MSRTAWEADMARFNRALHPYLMETEDGSFITPEAPEALTRPYTELVSLGYLRGWL